MIHSDDEYIYLDMSDEHSLAHFGIKGMKWGVRKERGTGPSTAGAATHSPKAVLTKALAKKPPIAPSSDFTKAQTILKKRPQEMTNEELKHLTSRLNLEKQYKQLNPNVAVRGKLLVAGVIAAGTMALKLHQLATHDVTKKAAKGLGNAVSSAAKGKTN